LDAATDVDDIFVAAAADNADVALVRTHTTVGAAGHTHTEFFVRQAQPF
jgi:hypothetical protein